MDIKKMYKPKKVNIVKLEAYLKKIQKESEESKKTIK